MAHSPNTPEELQKFLEEEMNPLLAQQVAEHKKLGDIIAENRGHQLVALVKYCQGTFPINTPIDKLPLWESRYYGTRGLRILKTLNINTIADLKNISQRDLRRERNCGKNTLSVILMLGIFYGINIPEK